MSTDDGVTKQLQEETGFNSMPDALQHIAKVKNSISMRKYSIDRGEYGYGLYIYGEGENVITAVEGWENPEQARAFLEEMRLAMLEGTKVMA